MLISKKGLERLKADEGLKLTIYKCSAGKDTIGYGHNLETPISQAAADIILQDDIERVVKALELHDWFNKLNQPRKDVLINVAFNIGVNGLLNFRRMISAIDRDYPRFDVAAWELLDSRYAYQVKDRAVRLARILKTGKYEDE